MFANVGDWLIVTSHTENRETLRAEILAVRSGGRPPYTVRWTDDGRESLVFPGPDAEVSTAAQQADFHRRQAERIDRLQAEMSVKRASHEAVRP